MVLQWARDYWQNTNVHYFPISSTGLSSETGRQMQKTLAGEAVNHNS